MAFPNIYPNGLGFSLGDNLLLQGYLAISGTVYYVDNSSPAASDNDNDGTQENLPLESLEEALDRASSGDTIIVGADHSEILGTGGTFSQDRLTIVGAGDRAGQPTARITFTQSTFLDFTGSDVTIGKLIVESLGVISGGRLNLSGNHPHLRDLRVECRTGLNTYMVWINDTVDRAVVTRLTGVSTAAAGEAPPQGVLRDRSQVRFDAEAITVDGGAVGFSDAAVLINRADGKVIHVEDTSQLRGADVTVDSNNDGWIGVGLSTGQSRLRIADLGA